MTIVELHLQNGLFCNLNESGTTDVSTSPGSGGSSIADELTDLRRQVVFLQGQVEDRDRTIQTRDRTIELLEVNNEVNRLSRLTVLICAKSSPRPGDLNPKSVIILRVLFIRKPKNKGEWLERDEIY